MRVIVAVIAAGSATIALAQTPSGGIFDKAVNSPGIGWSLYGANQSAKQVAAADLPGGNAVRIQVSRAAAHSYDVGATYPTVKPVAAGDTMLVMVFLRAPNVAEGAELSLPIGATEADAPYATIAAETVKVGPTWKRFYAAGVAPKAFAPGKARIAIQLGGAKQVVEVGPAFLFDLGAGFDRAKLPTN